jgi:hypothetical protein
MINEVHATCPSGPFLRFLRFLRNDLGVEIFRYGQLDKTEDPCAKQGQQQATLFCSTKPYKKDSLTNPSLT